MTPQPPRLTWLDGVAHALSEPVERMQLPTSKVYGVQCTCSAVLRRATAEEINAWRQQQ